MSGVRGKTEEEQELAKLRRNFKDRLRRHYIKIHQQLYGFALETTSEKRLSGQRLSSSSPLSIDSPDQSSKKLFADGKRSPSEDLNPYDSLPSDVIQKFEPPYNPNYDQHHFDLPLNAVAFAETGAGKTTFAYNFIKFCGITSFSFPLALLIGTLPEVGINSNDFASFNKTLSSLFL